MQQGAQWPRRNTLPPPSISGCIPSSRLQRTHSCFSPASSRPSCPSLSPGSCRQWTISKMRNSDDIGRKMFISLFWANLFPNSKKSSIFTGVQGVHFWGRSLIWIIGLVECVKWNKKTQMLTTVLRNIENYNVSQSYLFQVNFVRHLMVQEFMALYPLIYGLVNLCLWQK